MHALSSDLLNGLWVNKKFKFKTSKPMDKLTEYFSSAKSDRPITVVLVDEIDFLVTKSQAVVYQLFDWPLLPHSKLVLIAISNTMDLPERLMPRVASRLGLARLNYLPYQKDQIRQVLTERLREANAEKVFSDQAIVFCAQKVANTSGDIRTALHMCRRAIEIRAGPVVSPTDVNRASFDLYSSPFQAVIAHLPYCARLVLVALVLCLKANNSDSALLREVHDRFAGLATTFGPAFKFRPITFSDFERLVSQLEQCAIVSLSKHNPNATASAVCAEEDDRVENEEELQACISEKKVVRGGARSKAIIGKDNGAEDDEDGSSHMLSLSRNLEFSDIQKALVDKAGDKCAQQFLR